MDFRDYDTRLAAYAVIVDAEDRILLALWNEAEEPMWTLPGGGVELPETTTEGVLREVREETGYDVAVGPVLGVDTHVVEGPDRMRPQARPLKSVRVVYAASVIGGGLRHEVDGTTDEARWWPLTDVDSLGRVSLVDVGIALWREAASGRD